MKPHTILKDFHGSQTGHDHHHFAAGTVADLSHDLAQVAVLHGLAKPVEEAPAAPPPEAAVADAETGEEKALGDAPANKMKKAAPENKSKKGD
jgi:hypothetical protein